MDIHIHHRPLDAYENIIEYLKKKYIRITEARKAIIAYIIDSHEHPSANKICGDLLPEHPNMSLATVYNNIKALVDEGLAVELKMTNDTTTYYDLTGHQYINIVCKDCDEIANFMDVDVIDTDKEVHEQTGYQITKIWLTAYGICPKRQEKLKTAGESFITYYGDK